MAEEKVFSNSSIVDRIVSFGTKDFKELGRLRTINKTFNTSVKAHFRKTFVTTKLQCPKSKNYTNYIIINNQKFQNLMFCVFLQFLKVSVQVKVKNLTLLRFQHFYPCRFVIQAIHDFIKDQKPRKLVGLSQIHSDSHVQSCEKCDNMLGQLGNCKVFGPTTPAFWRKFRRRTRHFKEIQVGADNHPGPYFVYQISAPSQRATPFELKAKMIPLGISCDHLVIWMDRYCQYGISINVIQELVEKWKVKSIGIKQLITVNISGSKDELLHLKDKRLGDETPSIPSFPEVTIDLTEAFSHERKILFITENGVRTMAPLDFPIHQNLLHNVLKVLPTGKLVLKFPPEFRLKMRSFLEIFLKRVEDVKLRNTEISLNPWFDNDSLFSDYKIEGRHLEVLREDVTPQKIKFCFDETSMKEEKYIAKKMTIRDGTWNLQLDINYFLKEGGAVETSEESLSYSDDLALFPAVLRRLLPS